MTRRYKLERLQKHIILGISSAALASTIFFGGAQDTIDYTNTQDVIVGTTVDSPTDTALEIKVLNKANKEKERLQEKHIRA